jgi:hypothetical protein
MPAKNKGGVASEKPTLTSQLCQQIVVQAAPSPSDFTGPDQVLAEVGIIDTDQANFHRDGITKALKARQFKIDPRTIDSGPAITVSACSASVEANAK